MKSLFSTTKLSWITKHKSVALALTLGIALGVAFDRVPSLASGITSVNVPIKTQVSPDGPVDVHQQLELMQKQLDDLKSLRSHWAFPFDGLDTWMPQFDDSIFRQVRSPLVSTSESKDSVKITADLPGVDEKDIEVIVSDRSVTIKGERDQEKFTRSIYFSTPVKPEQGKATLSKGVLTVELPKGTNLANSGHKLPIHTE
jgi:HSP20 family molecular chaperone IbpA